MLRTFPGILCFLLVVSAALAADPTPEEVYKKVAGTWSAAKTVHIQARCTESDPDTKPTNYQISIWLASDNRFLIDASIMWEGKTERGQMICDGSWIVEIEEGKETLRYEAAKDIGESLRSSLLARGPVVTVGMLGQKVDLKSGGVSDFKPLFESKANDRPATVLEFAAKFNTGKEDVTTQMRLFLDKEKLQPLRREMVLLKENHSSTEEYPSTELDAEPPAYAFKLPPPPPKEGK